MTTLPRKFALTLITLVILGIVACAGNPLIEPDRIQYPTLKMAPPKTERILFDNGIVLYFIEDHELPLVEISAVFRAGSNYDPLGREGLSDLTASTLRAGGIVGMSGDAVDQELDSRAALISFSSDFEACSAALSMHRKDLDPVMQLFAGMVREPAFNDAKLAVAKNLMKESLLRVYDDQQRLAFREFRKLIYQDNPRGRLTRLESIGKITRQDLVDFHRRYFFPANMRITITGDLSRQEALDLLKRHFGSWKHSSSLPAIPTPHPAEKGTVHMLNKVSPQTTIVLGYIVPGKSSPDFYALSVLDFLFGSGGFRSRITQAIRNERGLAYSAGGFYSARAQFGVLQIYAMTKASSTPEALSALHNLILTIQDRPASAEEVAWAKRALINRYIFSLESSHRIAYQQLMLDFEGLPPEFLTNYPKGIEGVTVQDIQRVARLYLSPQLARVLVVGNAKEFSPLSEFGKPTFIEWEK